jgi:hypothetical protein
LPFVRLVSAWYRLDTCLERGRCETDGFSMTGNSRLIIGKNWRATVINPTSLYGNVYANYLREIAQKSRPLKAALKPTDGFVRIVDSRSV